MNIRYRIKQELRYRQWHSKYAASLERFRNLHAGKDCFIIGNGPSLNQMDLTRLADHYTIGLNKIYLIRKRVDLHLSYLVAVNRLVIEQSESVYRDFDAPIFVSYGKSDPSLHREEHIHPIFSEGGQQWYFGQPDQRIFEGMTVTYVALQMAYFMGFERVFLIGVDHNFVQTGKPHEEQQMGDSDPNHFDPDYFAGQQWHLADLKGSEVSYQMADYHFRKNKRMIYDATLNGKLQIFDKTSYEQALQWARKRT